MCSPKRQFSSRAASVGKGETQRTDLQDTMNIQKTKTKTTVVQDLSPKLKVLEAGAFHLSISTSYSLEGMSAVTHLFDDYS